MDPGCARIGCRVPDRAAFHCRRTRRNAYHDFRTTRQSARPAMRLLDEIFDHLLSNIDVRNHAIAQRPDGFDIIWRFSHPQLGVIADRFDRSEEHTSELQSLMPISYAVFCLKQKTTPTTTRPKIINH